MPVKPRTVENIVVDEAHQRTYVVNAPRVLTDGEMYKAIRVELLKRKKVVPQGERCVIDITELD